MMDLGKWATEEYRIAGESVAEKVQEEDEIRDR